MAGIYPHRGPISRLRSRNGWAAAHGTTGINTLRIDSPTKQAQDHDPAGVDDAVAVKAAKERLYGLRGTATARAEADTIQDRHGSRKAGLPRTGMVRRQPVCVPQASPQRNLFAD